MMLLLVERTHKVHTSFGIPFLLGSTFVYGIIGLKMKTRMSSSRNYHFTKVTFLILGTFLVFLVEPDIIVYVISETNEEIFNNFWVQLVYAIGDVNFCIDPFMHVLGYEPVKVAFKLKVSKLCGCFSAVSTAGAYDEMQSKSERNALEAKIYVQTDLRTNKLLCEMACQTGTKVKLINESRQRRFHTFALFISVTPADWNAGEIVVSLDNI